MDGIQYIDSILNSQIIISTHQLFQLFCSGFVTLAGVASIARICDIKVRRYEEAIARRFAGKDDLAVGSSADDHCVTGGICEMHLVVHIGMPLVRIDPADHFLHRCTLMQDVDWIAGIAA